MKEKHQKRNALIRSQPCFSQKKLEKMLDFAHVKEMARQGAQAWNWGWFCGPRRIESKTDEGVLISCINLRGRVSHRWETCA